MLELLGHLLPDFSLLFTPGFGSPDLGALLIAVMLIIMALSIFFLLLHALHCRRRLLGVWVILEGQSHKNLAEDRLAMKEKSKQGKDRQVFNLWREFDESLVYSADKKQLFNTLDAEHFFNNRSLASGLTSSRLLSAAPTFLTAIGVLGTFIGLTIGLKDLQVNADEISTLKNGVSAMINGAAVAFMTSVWGVGLSLTLNVIEKMVERWALSKISRLQQKIDYLYPRLPAERSLVQIAAAADESKEALQELHERIGDRLQETMAGVSESMQQAFTDALNNVMAPAIQTLVNNASQQSTNVLENLVGNFMAGIKSAGSEQGLAMQSAAEEVRSAVSSMSVQMEQLNAQSSHQLRAMQSAGAEQQMQLSNSFESTLAALKGLLSDQAGAAVEHQRQIEQRFDHQVEKLAGEQQQLLSSVTEATQTAQQHMAQMAAQHQALLAELSNAARAVETSSQNMNNSANQLGLLSSNLARATELLDKRLEVVTTSLESAAGQNQALAGQVIKQAETLRQLQGELTTATQHFERAANSAEQGFASLNEHQREFLQGINKEFQGLGNTLKQQVQAIEQQAEQWLRSYAEEVNTQVSERMEQWNRSTLEFADQMRNTVSAISGLVDDLESKR